MNPSPICTTYENFPQLLRIIKPLSSMGLMVLYTPACIMMWTASFGLQPVIITRNNVNSVIKSRSSFSFYFTFSSVSLSFFFYFISFFCRRPDVKYSSILSSTSCNNYLYCCLLNFAYCLSGYSLVVRFLNYICYVVKLFVKATSYYPTRL